MVLNIFPRRERTHATPPTEPEATLPEPSPEALDDPGKKTRRGTRGGRGRRKPAGDTAEATTTNPEPSEGEEPAVAAPRARRPRATKPAGGESPAANSEANEPEPTSVAPAKRSTGRKAAFDTATTPADLSSLVKVVEAQGRQIEHLIRATEDAAKRGAGAGGAATHTARVGVFVDSANVELALDRLRARVDWRKVLNLLVDGRALVRATAYSPVHDDPGVSIETQRFAEPFLGKGYKVVTKPLKRFADGTIKANVDIEMALDIIEMLDRLDVVCLVSGDGDFERLVDVVQGKGVRVEVAAVGSSAASGLRNAADQYIDLQSLLQKLRA